LGVREQERHSLPAAGFPTGDAIDRCSYAVKNDDRALCFLQNRLVFLVELFAGLKFEVLARLAPPLDLTLAIVTGLDVRFQFGKSASATCNPHGQK